MTFVAITRIARQYGISVHLLKTLLGDAGYLDGNKPSSLALRHDIAKWHVPAGGDTDKPLPRWNLASVAAVISKAGEDENRGLGVWSLDAACDRLAEAAGLLSEVGAFCRARAAHDAGLWFMFEKGEVLLAGSVGGRKQAAALVADRLRPIMAWFKRTTVRDRPDVARARRLIEAAMLWLRIPVDPDRRTAGFRSLAYLDIHKARRASASQGEAS